MKKLRNLGIFVLLVFLFLGQALLLARYYTDLVYKREVANMWRLQKVQIALTLVSFHSYYHVWPVPPGALDTTAYLELGGFSEAKINTQHINFFQKNNCDGLLVDEQGHYFLFVPDESIGTCTVHSELEDIP